MMKKSALWGILLWVAALPACAGCVLGKVATLDVSLVGNELLVPGSVNGHDVEFVVDTGAETLLFPDRARSFGVNVGGLIGQMYSAAGRETMVEQATIENFALGKWTGHNVSLPAVGIGKGFADERVIGLLGEDILSHFDVEIDIPHHLFALYQPQDCETANLAYWTDSYNVADFVRFNPEYPAIMVNGRIGDSPVLVELDTGAYRTVMSLEIARALGVGPGDPGVENLGPARGLNGQSAETWAGTFPSFTLDQEAIKPAKLAFFQFSRVEPENGSLIRRRAFDADMLLGIDFIRSHHLFISHSQRKLYFSYSGGKVF
jgi:hypothetical protein